ncbi:MAG: hypothetical protein CM15mP84_07070 [Cellvibrionales bacterium]|nr:MAG: hypothetical protein CM15mP84_07070 [Cellvibrionales bacterium]
MFLTLVRDEDAARYGGARSAEPSAAANKVGGLTELLGGKLYLDNIDCNADPHALNKAYIDNSQYSYIQFTITGSCYGHFTLIDGRTLPPASFRNMARRFDSGNVGTEDSPLPRPKLIANPFSNNMSLYGSFGVDSTSKTWILTFLWRRAGVFCSPRHNRRYCPFNDHMHRRRQRGERNLDTKRRLSLHLHGRCCGLRRGILARNNVSAAIYYHVSQTLGEIGCRASPRI